MSNTDATNPTPEVGLQARVSWPFALAMTTGLLALLEVHEGGWSFWLNLALCCFWLWNDANLDAQKAS